MERYQLENLYQLAGLDDYKIRDSHNLLECHGIRLDDIKGYSKLDEVNSSIFYNFIINFYNMQGMMSRAGLQPKGIYFVEDIENVAYDPDEDEEDSENRCVVTVNQVITAIYKDGSREVIHKRGPYKEEYKNLPIKETYKKNYLRFEYTVKSYYTVEDKDGEEHNAVKERKEWLHVIDGGEQWY